MKENEELRYINDNLRREDLSPAQQELYDYLGRERYIEFCESFGGISLVVSKLETLRKTIVKRQILEDMDLYESGKIGLKQLAKMHNVSSSTVYNILKEGKK